MYDQVLREHLRRIENRALQTGKRVQGSYISHCIQNEFIAEADRRVFGRSGA